MNWQYISFYYPPINAFHSFLPLDAFSNFTCFETTKRRIEREKMEYFELQYTIWLPYASL